MPIRWLIPFIMALLFVGCRDTEAPATMQEYAGLYKYISPPEYKDLSLPWLRLMQDGIYTTFANKPGQQERVLKRGRWRVISGANLRIALDQEVYSIGHSGSRLHIVLNDDRGEYYEKVE